jgi:hypothetical protein
MIADIANLQYIYRLLLDIAIQYWWSHIGINSDIAIQYIAGLINTGLRKNI